MSWKVVKESYSSSYLYLKSVKSITYYQWLPSWIYKPNEDTGYDRYFSPRGAQCSKNVLETWHTIVNGNEDFLFWLKLEKTCKGQNPFGVQLCVEGQVPDLAALRLEQVQAFPTIGLTELRVSMAPASDKPTAVHWNHQVTSDDKGKILAFNWIFFLYFVSNREMIIEVLVNFLAATQSKHNL